MRSRHFWLRIKSPYIGRESEDFVRSIWIDIHSASCLCSNVNILSSPVSEERRIWYPNMAPLGIMKILSVKRKL